MFTKSRGWFNRIFSKSSLNLSQKILLYGMVAVLAGAGIYAFIRPKPQETIEPTPSPTTIVEETPSRSEGTAPVEEVKKEEKSQSKAQTSNSANKTVPVSNTKPDTKKQAPPKQAEQPKTSKCTTNSNHGVGVGNSNKWYSTKANAIAEYTSKVKYWSEKWENYEIDTPIYNKNCPSGYEVWSCPFCNKWTINYFYN